MKIEINLNVPLKGIDGEAIKESNLGKLLGTVLVSTSKGDALKYYDWACTLHKGESILVDRSDFENIEIFVKQSENLQILAKAQIQILLSNCEKLAREKKHIEEK